MTTERKIAVGALLVAASGIPIQIAGKADYPGVPPGLFVLLAAAGLFALQKRWAPIVGLVLTFGISLGGVLTPNLREQLGEPSDFLIFFGSVIQTIGLVAGLVFGFATIRQSMRREGQRA